ncbi:hypothetical protein L211DRAFT_354948 [Terfezia boudieri ATCC MYA-4762]|uniref:Endoplasmic reticulum protein n=1 Tax=Terfezia boudieri ATCC MYA-4762 TaxID=1051890 RepID=A0A3N4LKI3_9PEZI|nr:hypothetical protein L211DRAFT_354948 [Terfezia boudieri ATCC MYA-4762]
MAPQPQTLALSDRLMALVQTLQFSWFMGHLTLLVSTIYYTIAVVRFNAVSTAAAFSYRLAFLSAAVTYGIVVFKAYRAKIQRVGVENPQQQVLSLLGDENVQYLVMALIWLYSNSIWFALLPFAVYSTFHFLSYLRTNVIPTFAPATPAPGSNPAASPGPRPTVQHPLSEYIAKFVRQNYDTSMHLVSNLEIFLWARVFLGALVFKNSWVLLLCYTLFLRIRYAQSSFVRQAFQGLERKGDALVNDARVPDGARNGWRIGKDVVKKAREATSFLDTPANGTAGRKTQ